MSIAAKVLADSVNPAGSRLTTLELKFPRFILAEFNTYRVWSRNARSSRAVPTAKLIAEIEADPVIPVEWGKNRKGMSATEVFDKTSRAGLRIAWRHAANRACEYARWMADEGVHKQVVNRLLEPFMWAHVVVSATEWANFYAQRLAPDAQPEMQALAMAMGRALLASEPRALEWGEWHLPYVTDEERDWAHGWGAMVNLSAARCARVSYRPFDADKADPDADHRLAGDLIRSGHWSPFEHPARASEPLSNPGRDVGGGNFGPGWIQSRKLHLNENRRDFDWRSAVASMADVTL